MFISNCIVLNLNHLNVDECPPPLIANIRNEVKQLRISRLNAFNRLYASTRLMYAQNILGLGPFKLALLTCTSSALAVGIFSLTASRLRTARNWLTSFLISEICFNNNPFGNFPSVEYNLYYAISNEAIFALESILLNLATAITFALILAIFSSC